MTKRTGLLGQVTGMLLTMIFSTGNPAQADGMGLLQEPAVQRCAYCALKKVKFGRSQLSAAREQAFWVLETPAGLQCDFWDESYATSRSSYTLGVPANAIGLFHTHPAHEKWLSKQDIHESVRLEKEYRQGIVFYVLAGKKYGVLDPRTHGQAAENWYSSSPWLDSLPKPVRAAPCEAD